MMCMLVLVLLATTMIVMMTTMTVTMATVAMMTPTMMTLTLVPWRSRRRSLAHRDPQMKREQMISCVRVGSQLLPFANHFSDLFMP